MVTDCEVLVRPVFCLEDVFSSPEDPVSPGWGPEGVAGVPGAGAGVVLGII